MILRSIKHANLRYRLAWYDDAFRSPAGSLSYAAWFDTLGDGDTAHTADRAVYQLPMCVDFSLSLVAALQPRVELSEEASQVFDLASLAIGYQTRMSIAEAWDCVAAAQAHDSKGPAYWHEGKIKRGKRLADLRSAEPIGRLSEDASPAERLSLALHWYTSKYQTTIARIRSTLDLLADPACPVSMYSWRRETCDADGISTDDMDAMVQACKGIERVKDSLRNLTWHKANWTRSLPI